MADLSRFQLIGYAIAACLVVVLGVRYLHPSHGSSGAPASPAGGGSVQVRAASAAPAVVDVTGSVRRPGVYRLSSSARVEAAVQRAGGPTGKADLSAVNLAAKVTDGAQIVVPARATAGGSAAAPAGGAAAAAGAAPAGPVNLNTATAEQLDALDGVGPVTAQKIVEYRKQHGGFGSVNELDRIPGIGPKRLAGLRGKVTG